MSDTSPFQPSTPTPEPNTPVDKNLDITQSTRQPRNSISDQLSHFSDYLSEYPARLTELKSFAIIGLMFFGSITGVVLLRQNLDTRKQASEGSTPKVCKLTDPAKMATKKLQNTTECYLDGKSYFACDDGYMFTQNQCIATSSAK